MAREAKSGLSETPKVLEYMTLVPRTVGAEVEISKADAIMRDHDIRHLPVLEAGKLVGIISDRDVRIAKSFPGPGVLTVEDVMARDPYVVDPDAFIDDVVSHMLDKKLGSAIVQSANGKIVGIFTTVDALRALKFMLEKRTAHKAA
jgi:acetoin utilization protein AcuB